MATLGLSKVFILDKYFTELQKFWETEKKLQGEYARATKRVFPKGVGGIQNSQWRRPHLDRTGSVEKTKLELWHRTVMIHKWLLLLLCVPTLKLSTRTSELMRVRSWVFELDEHAELDSGTGIAGRRVWWAVVPRRLNNQFEMFMVARSDAEKASELEGNHSWNVNKRDIGYRRSCDENTGLISSFHSFDNRLVAQC